MIKDVAKFFKVGFPKLVSQPPRYFYSDHSLFQVCDIVITPGRVAYVLAIMQCFLCNMLNVVRMHLEYIYTLVI